MRLPTKAATTALVVALVAAVACGGTATDPRDEGLNGAWTARSSGVAELLNLAWTTDSVKGTGTYTSLGNELGCGGGTLTGSGTVTFRASRSGSTITGVMAFDNGWTPPYTGTLVDNTRIDGAFRSIDSGSCPFALFFGLIP